MVMGKLPTLANTAQSASPRIKVTECIPRPKRMNKNRNKQAIEKVGPKYDSDEIERLLG